MTLGGGAKRERCDAAPVFLATENRPGPDGQRGSMALCAACSQVLSSQMPGYATIRTLDEAGFAQARKRPAASKLVEAFSAQLRVYSPWLVTGEGPRDLPTDEAWAAAVRFARLQRGWTRERLAFRLGVEPCCVQTVEDADVEPDEYQPSREMELWAACFGKTLAEMSEPIPLSAIAALDTSPEARLWVVMMPGQRRVCAGRDLAMTLARLSGGQLRGGDRGGEMWLRPATEAEIRALGTTTP